MPALGYRDATKDCGTLDAPEVIALKNSLIRASLLLSALFSLATACGSDDQGSATGLGKGGGGGSGGTISIGASGGTTPIPTGGGSGGGSAGSSPNPTLATDVNVIITADNAYGFGYGTATELLNYQGGVENPRSQDIFSCPVGMGPEAYTVPAANANVGGYLYIVTYADKSTTQGVIAKFSREGGLPVFTGNGAWEGCATGQDFDPGSGGPSLAEINAEIAKCNGGTGNPATTSAGWVGTAKTPNGYVVFGEDNSTDRGQPTVGNEFLIACDIDAAARWMWFEWDPNRTSGSPFMWPGGNANTTKDFLIFRLGAENVPPGTVT